MYLAADDRETDARGENSDPNLGLGHDGCEERAERRVLHVFTTCCFPARVSPRTSLAQTFAYPGVWMSDRVRR